MSKSFNFHDKSTGLLSWVYIRHTLLVCLRLAGEGDYCLNRPEVELDLKASQVTALCKQLQYRRGYSLLRDSCKILQHRNDLLHCS